MGQENTSPTGQRYVNVCQRDNTGVYGGELTGEWEKKRKKGWRIKTPSLFAP
jgi:hypothetical protein